MIVFAPPWCSASSRTLNSMMFHYPPAHSKQSPAVKAAFICSALTLAVSPSAPEDTRAPREVSNAQANWLGDEKKKKMFQHTKRVHREPSHGRRDSFFWLQLRYICSIGLGTDACRVFPAAVLPKEMRRALADGLVTVCTFAGIPDTFVLSR